MVELRPFLRRTLRDLVRDFRHVAVVAGKFDAVERHHLRGSGVVQLFNFGTVWQRNRITATFRGLRFKETAHFSAWRSRRCDAWDFHFLRFFAAFRYRRATRFGVSRDGIRALQNAFLRIFFIDECGNTLVAALVSIHLAHDIERVGPFLFRGFGDGIVHFRLAAIEALHGNGVVRFQLNCLIFWQLNDTVNHTVFRCVCFWRIVFIQRNGYALVAAVAIIRLVNNVKRGRPVFISGF